MTQKVTLSQFGANAGSQLNVGLLGFKMAVNDSITVFNLVDGVVDEFHSEDGADEGEGSNDTYCASSDWYINSTQPTGASATFSAGFTTTSITEPDTSVTGTNPDYGAGTFGTFTVPTGMTSLNMQAWGAAGGSSMHPQGTAADGGQAASGDGGSAAGTVGKSLASNPLSLTSTGGTAGAINPSSDSVQTGGNASGNGAGGGGAASRDRSGAHHWSGGSGSDGYVRIVAGG